MFYRAIGVMSGSSLDGLDLAFVEFEETGGKWSYAITASACYEYEPEWLEKLQSATTMNSYDYMILHTAYGKYIGEKINLFIDENNLHHRVQIIGSHGHTTFHAPQLGMTHQLGDGAAIAAITNINVVSDLRNMDVALGGQGAPIVPVGEKLLFNDVDILLNLGGIANISFNKDEYLAFDVCAANRVLNLLANNAGKQYDEDGNIAAGGKINDELLEELNSLDYYAKPYPKSLANSFGTETVYPLIKKYNLSNEDALRTYTEHIAVQISNVMKSEKNDFMANGLTTMLVTGGGAHNKFLIERLQALLPEIEIIIPESELINNKEALIMALLGILRWREENTVLSSVTGASRNSIGGAVWMGQEA